MNRIYNPMNEANTLNQQNWRGIYKYKLYPLKMELASLPANEAFQQFCKKLDIRESLELRHIKAQSMQVVAKDKAKKYFELAPSGIPFINRAPNVIGDGNHRDLHCKTRTLYVACFKNARLYGESATIEVGDDVLLDFEPWELARMEENFQLDACIFRSNSDDIWYIHNPSESVDIQIDRGFKLTGANTRTFGHWIWEYLPKYVAALISKHMPPLTIIVDKNMPSTHMEALQKLLPNDSNILPISRGTSVKINELWCTPSLSYWPIIETPRNKNQWDYKASPTDRFLPSIDHMISKFSIENTNKQLNRRIYLSRKYKTKRRNLVNGDSIEKMAACKGFEIIYPEKLNFYSQIEAIRSAKYIIAPEGSSIYLAFFARPDTKLLILDSPYIEGQATGTDIMQARRIVVTILTGTCVNHNYTWEHYSDYKISEDAFSKYLSEWIF